MFGLKSLAIGSAAVVLMAVGSPVAQAATGLDYAAASSGSGSGSATSSGSSGESANSTDWSGWDATGGTYTSVSAAWTVPTVTCVAGETSYSADWVGLDGDGSDSVEQTGTSSDCDSGTPVYSAWYEFYPSVAVTLPDTVKAGDKITASVVSVKGTDQFRLVLTDTTQKWTKTQTGLSPEGTGASAEIVAEAPSGSERANSVLPLADFKTVTFSDVLVNGAALGGTDGAQKIAMVDDYENPMATVSELTGSDEFTITWVSSGDSTGTEQSSSDQGSGTGSGGYGSGGYGSGGYGSGGGWGYSSGGGYSDGSSVPGDAGVSNTWTDTVGEAYGSAGSDASS